MNEFDDGWNRGREDLQRSLIKVCEMNIATQDAYLVDGKDDYRSGFKSGFVYIKATLEEKSLPAVELGSLGGKASAAKLSKAQRKQRAKHASSQRKVLVRKCPSCLAGFSREDIKGNCTCDSHYSLRIRTGVISRKNKGDQARER